MSGLDSLLQPLTNQAAVAPPVGADTTTPDGVPPSWSTAAAASFRGAIDETPFVQQQRLSDAYIALAGKVAQAAGKSPYDYELPWTQQAANMVNPWGQSDPIDRDAVWRDAARMAATGTPIAGATNQQEFESTVLTRGGRHQADAEMSARGGFGSSLLPSLAAMPASPANMAAAVIGGPELPEVAQAVLGKTLSGMASAGLTNMAVQGVMEPSSIAARERLGETVTGGDVATDIATAGAFGAGMHGAATVLGHFIRAVPPIYRTPVEQAAVNVAERSAEVEGSNPFPDSTAAMDLHKQRLSEAMGDLNAGRVPGASPGFAPVARDAAPAASGIDPQIEQFFLTKGYEPAQARGIAAGIQAESRSNPDIVNPTSGALGIGQWLGSRKAALISEFGNHPTMEQQLEFLHGELQGGDAGGVHVLAAHDEGAVLDAYVRKFMRPKAGAETAGDLARGAAALGGAGDVQLRAEMAESAAPSSAEGDFQGVEEAQAEAPDADLTPDVQSTSASTMASEAEAPLSVQVLMPGLRAALEDRGVSLNRIDELATSLDAHPDDVRAGLQQLVAQSELSQRSDNGGFMRRPRDPDAQDGTPIARDAPAIAEPEQPPARVDSATMQRFDDPASEGVRATADGAWHDVVAKHAPPPVEGAEPSTAVVLPKPEPALFDIGDGKGPRSVAALHAEFESDAEAVAHIQACL